MVSPIQWPAVHPPIPSNSILSRSIPALPSMRRGDLTEYRPNSEGKAPRKTAREPDNEGLPRTKRSTAAFGEVRARRARYNPVSRYFVNGPPEDAGNLPKSPRFANYLEGKHGAALHSAHLAPLRDSFCTCILFAYQASPLDAKRYPSLATPIEIADHVVSSNLTPASVRMCDANSVRAGSNVRQGLHACDTVLSPLWSVADGSLLLLLIAPPKGHTAEQAPQLIPRCAYPSLAIVDCRARVRYGLQGPGLPGLGRVSGSPASPRHSVIPLRRNMTPIPQPNRIAHCMSHTHVLGFDAF
ncbi:hypothetical protein TgHK011_009344 [Trichoderma gracile]|nr:hypothetical protein TgHK011_009344 [Trichoderma gracile]